MKRTMLWIAGVMFFGGLAFSETNTDEQALENLVNSAKSNAQSYKAEKETNSSVPESTEQKNIVQEKSTNQYLIIPFNLSIVPLFGFGYKTINYIQVNIGAGYCDILQGVSAGFVNIAAENVNGVDCSLVGFTGHDFNGSQFSLVTFTGNDFNGAQAGLVNIVNGNFHTMQAGLVNLVGGDFKAVQLGLVNIVGGNFDGFRAGLVNISGNRFKGCETGLVNLTWNSFEGPQVGLVNFADKVKGIQLGLVNFAGEIDGVSIGLVSIVAKNGQTHGQLWIDETGFVNAAFIHGTKTIYNIYSVGMDVTASYWSYGLGLGVHLPMDPFYINIEGMSSSVSHIENWDGLNTLTRVRVYAGFSLFEHLSFVAGVSLNYYRNWTEKTLNINPFYPVSKSFDNNDKLWPGIFVGIQF